MFPSEGAETACLALPLLRLEQQHQQQARAFRIQVAFDRFHWETCDQSSFVLSLQDLLSHILLLHQSAQLQQLRQVQTEQWPQVLQVQMHMFLNEGKSRVVFSFDFSVQTAKLLDEGISGINRPSPSSNLRQERHLRELQQLQPPWPHPQASGVCFSQVFGPREE